MKVVFDTLSKYLQSFHIPTALFAIAVAVAAQFTLNGQPLDITTGDGRTAIVLAVVGGIAKVWPQIYWFVKPKS